MPQDVRLSANGKIFHVADMAANGIWLISAQRFRVLRFIHTGVGTHGFIVGRSGTYLYISNRGEGSISVLDFATGKLVHKWRIPVAARLTWRDLTRRQCDVGSGRYNAVVYAMSVRNGRLLAKISVGAGPHGLCVFPQPGRYSLGHTGNFADSRVGHRDHHTLRVHDAPGYMMRCAPGSGFLLKDVTAERAVDAVRVVAAVRLCSRPHHPPLISEFARLRPRPGAPFA